MISSMFEVISQAIVAFTSSLASAFSGIGALFYTEGTNGASGTWTFLGTLLLVAVGVGVVYLCYNVIRALIRRV